MLFQGLAFNREHGRAACGDCCCGVILSGENVARGPAYICAKIDECFNQDSGLDGHVQ